MITTADAIEKGHTTDSASTDEQSKSQTFRQKENDNIIEAQTASDTIEPVYESGWKLWAILCTIFSTTLLAALDIGIIATAIPGITDDFHRLDDVGWYGSACFLLAGTSSPLWGKLYKYLSARWVYLSSIILFLIGSVVAATAPNSIALIIARAIQGFGVAGTFAGSVLMINFIAPPNQRPMLIGLWMAVLMTSTVIGPLIGGAFTTSVSWRWCFWINLPVGGPIVGMVLLFFHVPKHVQTLPATWKEILLQLDIPGFSLLLSSVVCLTLALQYGGQTKKWSDGSVIATLVMWVVLSIAFVTVEWVQGSCAMVPLNLLKPRMAWTLALYALIVNVADFQVQFYLPIYFQSIHGQSAIASGVNCLPFVAFFALGSVMSGGLIGKTRMLHPYLFLSGLLATAGVTLLYTLDINSSKARYIGPEVLVGFGVGLGCQIPMMAIQSFTKPEHVATMSSIIVMGNTISGAYFISAAQSIFANRLLKSFAVNAPSINAIEVLGTGSSDIQRVFSGVDLAAVLDAYMVGIKAVFAFSMAGTALTAILTLAVPWKKIPSHGEKNLENNKPPTS